MENFNWISLFYLSIIVASYFQFKKSWKNQELILPIIIVIIAINTFTATDILNDDIILRSSAITSGLILSFLIPRYVILKKVKKKDIIFSLIIIIIVIMLKIFFPSYSFFFLYCLIPILFIAQIIKSWGKITKDLSFMMLTLQNLSHAYAGFFDSAITGYYSVVARVTTFIIFFVILLYIYEWRKQQKIS
jgi:hypothetical protein